MDQSAHALSRSPTQQPPPQKRTTRPRFNRSQSASADLSPPRPSTDRTTSTISTQPLSKKLPFPLQSGVDRAKHRGERIAHAFVDRTPVSAVADRVRGHERAEPLKRGGAAPNESAPDLVNLADADAAPVKIPQKKVTARDVEEETLRRFRRNEELQTTAESLTGLARDSTRRVDTMYYAILEKASSLRSSISGLKDLAQDSQRLLNSFENNAGQVDKDLGDQVRAFGGFEKQQHRVTRLEDRIHESMKKTETLSDRLEVARKRVELWEKRENEWQARTSSMNKILRITCKQLLIKLQCKSKSYGVLSECWPLL